jgi:hypothetical protein
VRICCHQCGTAVTPDLPEFPFVAYVLCLGCAEDNAGRAAAGDPGFVVSEPASPPHLTNILGEIIIPAAAGRLDEIRAQAEGAFGRWADEFLAALPALREAYRGMTPAKRACLGVVLAAFLQTRQAAHEEVDNPHLAFDLGFRVNVLDPSGPGGEYPGLYVGRGWQEAGPWVDLAAEAVAAWGGGREFAPTQRECARWLRGGFSDGGTQ